MNFPIRFNINRLFMVKISSRNQDARTEGPAQGFARAMRPKMVMNNSRNKLIKNIINYLNVLEKCFGKPTEYINSKIIRLKNLKEVEK